MSSNRKIIYLARHAKSSWDSGASKDFDRPLSNRGQRDAARMGKALNERGWKPQMIFSSPALRAQQTCDAYCHVLNISRDKVHWDEGFYAAYTVTLLHALTRLPESSRSVMLVGHNPSIEDVLIHLCEPSEIKPHYQKNGKLFTTGNVARLSVDGLWVNLAMAEARLDDLLRPKTL